MSFLRYADRIKRIDKLIRKKATGSPQELAERLGLSRSAVFEIIREMKKLGASISYCKQRQSYYYVEEKRFFIGFMKEHILEDL